MCGEVLIMESHGLSLHQQQDGHQDPILLLSLTTTAAYTSWVDKITMVVLTETMYGQLAPKHPPALSSAAPTIPLPHPVPILLAVHPLAVCGAAPYQVALTRLALRALAAPATYLEACGNTTPHYLSTHARVVCVWQLNRRWCMAVRVIVHRSM